MIIDTRSKAHIHNRLPAKAREKFNRMRRDADEARFLLTGASEKAANERERLLNFEAQFSTLGRNFEAGLIRKEVHVKEGHTRVTRDDAAMKEARELIEGQRNALRTATAFHQTKSEAASEMQRLVDKVETWLKSLAPEIEIIEIPAPQAKLGDDAPLAAVEKLRQQIAELRADMRATIARPIHSRTAKTFAKNYVDRLVEAGSPNCFSLIEGGRTIDFPTTRISGEVFGVAKTQAGEALNISGFSAHRTPDPIALLAWSNPGQFLKRLETEIDDVPTTRTR